MSKPSETPIVDALIGTFYMRCDECPQPEKCERAQFVNPDDARQLERSNVALRDALEKLAREVAELVSDKTLPEAALSHPSMAQARAALQGGK